MNFNPRNRFVLLEEFRDFFHLREVSASNFMASHTGVSRRNTAHRGAPCRRVAVLTWNFAVASMGLVAKRNWLLWSITDVIHGIARGVKPPRGSFLRRGHEQNKTGKNQRKKPNATQQQPPKTGRELRSKRTEFQNELCIKYSARQSRM